MTQKFVNAVISEAPGETGLPILSGTMGPGAVDIQSLYSRHNLLAYDPGFRSTASCKSAITFVDGDEGVGEQVEPPTQQDEFAADATDRRALIFPEVRNGLKVRHEPGEQPHQLDITLGLAFQAPAGLNPIEVPVDIEFE